MKPRPVFPEGSQNIAGGRSEAQTSGRRGHRFPSRKGWQKASACPRPALQSCDCTQPLHLQLELPGTATILPHESDSQTTSHGV